MSVVCPPHKPEAPARENAGPRWRFGLVSSHRSASIERPNPMTWAKVVVCFVVMALFGGILFTQESVQDKKPDGKGGKSAAEPKPAIYKVEKKIFKIEVTVKGILEAEKTAE